MNEMVPFREQTAEKSARTTPFMDLLMRLSGLGSAGETTYWAYTATLSSIVAFRAVTSGEYDVLAVPRIWKSGDIYDISTLSFYGALNIAVFALVYLAPRLLYEGRAYHHLIRTISVATAALLLADILLLHLFGWFGLSGGLDMEYGGMILFSLIPFFIDIEVAIAKP